MSLRVTGNNYLQTLKKESKPFFALGVPMALSSILSLTMNMVDTAVVGSYSTLELAALAAGHGVFIFLLVVFMALFNSLDTFFGFYLGKKDLDSILAYLFSAITLSVGLSLVAIPLLVLIAYNLHWFNISPDIAEVAKPYLVYLGYSYPFAIIGTVLIKFNQAFGNAKQITWLLVVINIINLFTDIALVHGVEGVFSPYGSMGAAFSTLICRIILLLGTAYLAFKQFERLKSNWGYSEIGFRAKFLFNRCKSIVKSGFPIALQIGLELFTFSASVVLATTLGEVSGSAHQIIFQICSFNFMVPLGFSSAIAMRVSNFKGNDQMPMAVKAGWIGIFYSGLVMGFFALIMLVMPVTLVELFTNDSKVIETALELLLLCAFFQVADGVQVAVSGALRGLGLMQKPLIANVIGHYVFSVPIALYLTFEMNLGLWGLWFGLAIGLTVVSFINLYFWIKSTEVSSKEPVSIEV